MMASCSRSSCSSLTDAGPGGTPGDVPVQPRTIRRPWCRAVSSTTSPRTRSPLPSSLAARWSPGARQPGIDQDCQVLLVLVLEFLDHELTAASRCSPVDPAWAVTLSDIHAAHDIPPAAPSGRGAGPAGFQSPVAASETSAGSDGRSGGRRHLIGQRAIVTRCSTSPKGDRVPRSRSAKSILATPWAWRLPANAHAIAAGDPSEEYRGSAAGCSRSLSGRPEPGNLPERPPGLRTSGGRFPPCNQ